MARISTFPRPPTSANAAPDIPEKIKTGKHIYLSKPPLHPSYKDPGTVKNPITDTGCIHEIPREDEKRNGKERNRIQGIHHSMTYGSNRNARGNRYREKMESPYL
jgi:hypothetical protein